MRKFSVGLAAFGFAAALLFAANVKTDYSHSADFGRYRTYSWIKVKASDSLWQDRIMRDIDGQFAAKGLNRVDSGGDLAVSAFGATQNERTLQTFYDNVGGGWSWRGFGDGMATTTVENTPVGTLVVDLFDTSNKKLVWRGNASDVLSDNPEKNEKKLEKSVHDLFKDYPPKSRG